MTTSKSGLSTDKTTIPYLSFNYRKFSNKVSMIGYIFASSLEQLDQFLFFQRWIYHVFEPKKEWAVKRFLSQIDRKLRVEWKKNLDHTFDWNAQEKIVSELLFTRVVNYYLIYIRDIAEHVARRTKLSEGTNLKIDLSNYPKVKRFFREKLEFSLYLTPEEENLAGQIITIRNLIVHNFNYIPDRFLTKFYNWKELACIKQDDDVFYIELDFSSLDNLGNFLSKSVAEIDDRISEEYEIEQYYFDEEDVPEEERSSYEYDIEDEDFFDEDE